MSSPGKTNSNQTDKWMKRLEIAVKVVSVVAGFVAAVNGIDSYRHHHPHGLNNHNDWNG